MIINLCFDFLNVGGVCESYWEPPKLQKNGERVVEILNSAPFGATHGLLPCFNRDKARSPETSVANQPSGIGLGWWYFP